MKEKYFISRLKFQIYVCMINKDQSEWKRKALKVVIVNFRIFQKPNKLQKRFYIQINKHKIKNEVKSIQDHVPKLDQVGDELKSILYFLQLRTLLPFRSNCVIIMNRISIWVKYKQIIILIFKGYVVIISTTFKKTIGFENKVKHKTAKDKGNNSEIRNERGTLRNVQVIDITAPFFVVFALNFKC
ncbi:unnamed protein product [Paramecium octaurelia]|uniref:Uncharacterized protein n=1 Tax=Paramecium octaurelia TaxID=43137 RepID=A0A8S1W8P0_PAROT|nr:unnamed protein product [Paramecium octaurelia]